MNACRSKQRAWTTFALAIAAVSIAIVNGIRAQEDQPKPEAEPSKLAADLVGAWQLAEAPADNVDETTKRLKFFGGKHWAISQSDKDGNVIFHHGGTYTLDGDEYVETVEYATQDTATLVGQRFKFKIKVEGDKYTQTGIGNPYNEVWQRAK
jgi:hypothetical protein